MASPNRAQHSFPTRRSSDLLAVDDRGQVTFTFLLSAEDPGTLARDARKAVQDRKSTRLNSSHVAISYAVFCLKKKIYERLIPVTLYCKRFSSFVGSESTSVV